MQRSDPDCVQNMHVGACHEQRFQCRRASFPTSYVQWRVRADASADLEVRACIGENLHDAVVVVYRRPMKRCHAVTLGQVHVGALFHKGLHGFPVTAHGGVGHRRVGGWDSRDKHSHCEDSQGLGAKFFHYTAPRSTTSGRRRPG